MRIKKMNACSKAHLMETVGLKGIVISGGHYPARYICSCGTVNNSGTCPHCGNTDFKEKNTNPFSNTGFIGFIDEVSTALDNPRIPRNIIAREGITVTEDFSSDCFSFEKSFVEVVSVNDTEISVGRIFTSENDLGIYDKFMSSLDILFTKEQREGFDLALSFKDKMPYLFPRKEGTAEYIRTLSNPYKVAQAIRTGFISISMEEFFKYHRLVVPFILSCRRMKSKIESIDSFMEDYKIPKILKDYYALPGCEPAITYGLSLPDSFSEESIAIPLMNALKYSVMHGQLRPESIPSLMTKAAELSQDEQIKFAEFFVRNVTFLNTHVLSRYNALKHIFKGIVPSVAVDVKKAAMITTEEYLLKRKVNNTRVTAALEALDKDPMVTLDLLCGKGKLSEEEKKAIDSL